MNILITAAGSPVFLSTFKSINENKNIKNPIIHACDMNNDALGLKLANKSFIVPEGNNKNFIEVVFQYCKKNNIEIIIPAADDELLPFSDNLNLFKKINCKIMVENKTTLESVQDKKILYDNISKEENLKNIVPNFLSCNSYNSFKNSYALIKKQNKIVCFKPSLSHGSRGFRIIKERLSKDYLFKNKTNPNIISYDQICDILNQDEENIPESLIMEYLPGDEYSVDCFKKDNKFYCVTRKRINTKEGICTTGITEKREDLIEISKSLYNLFNFKFSINIQFKYDINDQPKILEINPRLAGTMELSRAAGIDFSKLALDKILGYKNNIPIEPKWSFKMERIWQEIFSYQKDIFKLNDKIKTKHVFYKSKKQSKNNQKIALVDIDETICFYENVRKYNLAKPNYGNIQKINNLYNKGWKIIYWTGRGAVSGINYTEYTYQQLHDWGCLFHELITGTTLNNAKPHFDLLIDDKSKRIEEI